MFSKPRKMLSNRWLVFLATDCVLLLATIFVHRNTLYGAWRGDDLQQLFSAKDHSLLQLLFEPHAWQTFTAYFFTPFLAAQYKIDAWLFGYAPRSFFLHHLLDLAALEILTYHFLIRRFPPLLSFLACIGLLLSMPTFGIATFLHSRHYVAGLCFVIASVWLHQDAYRNNTNRNLFASAIFFTLAMSCREAYAVVLFYFLMKSWRSPLFIRSLLLYPALTGIFVVWRWYMLGNLVGGYYDGSLIDRIRALACVHRTIFGNDTTAAVCLSLIAAGAIYYRLLNLKRLIYLVTLLLAAYVPLLFATVMIRLVATSALRYAFFPTWLLFFGTTYLATLIWEKGNPKVASAILCSLIATITLNSAHQMISFREFLKEEDVQANFIRNGGPASAIFLSPAITGLNGNIHQKLAELAGLKPSNVISSTDDVVPEIASYWRYDHHCHCMARLSQAQANEALAKIPHIAAGNAPVALLVTWHSHRGEVRLTTAPGPLTLCVITFSGVLFECQKDMQFPESFLLPIPTERMDLSRARIQRIRSDGLLTSTPFMRIPWTGTVQWERGVFLPTRPRSQRQPTECHLDSPSQTGIRIKNSLPLELRGWIRLPSTLAPDDVPFAVLDDTKDKYYAANLYRESRRDQEKPGDLPTTIGGHVLDADISKVESGTYRLLLGMKDSLCDTGKTLAIESP